jgi:O-antigen ligase
MAKEKKKVKSGAFRKPEAAIPDWLVWLYALTSMAIIPVYFYKPAIDVTLMPKMMMLAIMLLTFVLIFLLIDKFRIPQISMLKKWPVLMWAGFTGMSVISLFVAINPQEGLSDIFKVTLLLIFLSVTAGIMIRTKSLNPFLVSATLMAIVLSLVGLSQYFTHAFRQPDLNALYKINGLMSHKNTLSGILFMALPLGCYAILTGKLSLRIIAGISVFLTIVLLILTQTRSIWIAVAAFVFVSGTLVFFKRRRLFTENIVEIRKHFVATGMILVLAFMLATWINNYSVRNPVHIPGVQPKEHIQQVQKRVASVFDTSSPNRVKRLEIWSSTLTMIADHPVSGVGAGNWKINAPNYYQPDPTEFHYHNWRRPHNDFLWILAEKGVPGLLLYLGFFVSFLILALKTIKKNLSVNHTLLLILMIAGITGYGADAFFAFPYERVEIQMYLMFFVAVILAVNHHSLPEKPEERKKHRRLILLGSAILLVFNINAIHKMIRAEIYTNYAHAAQVAGDWNSVVGLIDIGYNRRASLDPTNNPMYWYRGNANMRLNKLNEAKDDLELALRHNPHSVPVLVDLASVHYMLENYDKAAELFEECLRIFPMNRGALRGYGSTCVVLGRYEDALESYYKAMTDQPDPFLDELINQVYQKMAEN